MVSTKKMTTASLFAALTAVSAMITIPVWPVPITMQTAVVCLSGIILGSKYGAVSQLIYVLVGLLGVPIFGGMTGGFESVFKPSFGFLIGFIFAAYFAGLIVENVGSSKKGRVLASLVGIISPYLVGIPYMYMILTVYMGKDLNIIQILQMGLIPFVIGDTLKFFTVVFLADRVAKYFKEPLRSDSL